MRWILPALALAAAVGCTPEKTGGSTPTTPTGPGVTSEPPPATAAITTDMQLDDEMRQLWTEHVSWTRWYLMAAIADLPDVGAETDRLMQNQVDIGDAIRPFYGDDAADQLTTLLQAHITGAADVLAAAQSGDEAALDDANTAWHDNADAIASFLADANPAWDEGMLKNHMSDHLDLTLAEASDRLAGNWDADVADYDQIQDQILELADLLAAGIDEQFPALVAVDDTPSDVQLDHQAMRKLWEDHVIWTRVYIVSDVAGLGDGQAAADRLLANQVDIGDAVAPYFGVAAGDQLTTLLTAHILGAVAILDAAEAGDADAQATATDDWYANGHDIAVFLAGANPAWTVDDLDAMMKEHLDLTLEEATDRLTGDSGDIAAYDSIEAEILDMADTLSSGVVGLDTTGEQ